MALYDVEVLIDLANEHGNAHAVATRVEESLKLTVGDEVADQFRASFLLFVRQSDTTFEGILAFCEGWAEVKYVGH